MNPHALLRRRPVSPPAGPAAVEPAEARRPQRHTRDLVRAGRGLAVLGIGFLIVQRGQISLLERDLFRLVNDLPPLIQPVVWVVMQLGNVLAVPAVAAVAVLTRRFRLARDLLISGGL